MDNNTLKFARLVPAIVGWSYKAIFMGSMPDLPASVSQLKGEPNIPLILRRFPQSYLA